MIDHRSSRHHNADNCRNVGSSFIGPRVRAVTRVLVMGGAGMLGHKLCQTLGPRFDTFATFRSSPHEVGSVFQHVRPVVGVDVRDIATVEQAFRTARPDVVINAIGIVKQLPEANIPLLSIEVNALVPHLLNEICVSAGSRLIQVSTDCVFSGARGHYTEQDIPDPVDLYGRTKLLGEVTNSPIALTIRTSIIGRELGPPHGLVEWFLGQAGGDVEGYSRVVFSGLTTVRLANVISNIIESHSDLRGLWHVSSPPISKYELLLLINEAFGTGARIRRNSRIRSDRSINSHRFWVRTRLPQPSWPSMIEELRTDRTPYASVRSVTGAGRQSA